MSFGPNDISANDWAFSGANSFWTNWSTSVFASGALTRVTAISVRWGSNTGATITGHNNLWNTSNSRVVTTNGITTATTGTGTYNNDAVTGIGTWITSANYYGGMWRTQSQNSTTPFRDGSGGNYSGKSADDSTNSGGTTNWGGVASPGGMGWSATSTNTQIFVRKSGVWTACNVYVMKSAVWTICLVSIRKSGAWTALNWLQQGGEIPANGLPVIVSIDGGSWEPGLLVEEGFGWFGSIDPAALGLDDWTKPGVYKNVRYPAPFTGRYNSREPQEVAEARLYAYDRWQRSLKAGDQARAEYWKAMFQPELMPTMRTFEMNALELNSSLPILARRNPIITGGIDAHLRTT